MALQNPQPRSAVADEGLRRSLKRPTALAIVVGSVIGTGIYLRPAAIAQLAGSPVRVMLAWVLAGVLSLCGALTYARLAAVMPGTGGEYRYLRTTLGELPAFLYGWMRMTVAPAATSFLAVACTVFIGDVIPLGGTFWRGTLAGGRLAVDIGPRQVIAVALIVGLAWINTRGVGRAGRFQLVVTSLKVFGLVLFVTVVALLAPVAAAPVAPPRADLPDTLAFSGALLAAMSAYNGWGNAAIIAGEVEDAEKVIPWALVLGIVIVGVLYLATNAVYLHTLGFAELSNANSTAHPDAQSVAGKAAQRALGGGAATVLPLLFALSAIGTAHCNVLVAPRVYFSMARDGLLPASLATIAPVTGTPNRAIWAVALIAGTFALFGSYDRLSNMSMFGFLLFYGLTTAGYLRARGLSGSACSRRTFVMSGIVAAVFLCGSLWLLGASIIRGTTEVLAATALIGAGLPVYAALRWRRTLRGG